MDLLRLTGGRRPPSSSTVRFKQLTLRRTPNIRVGEKATINAKLADEDHTETTGKHRSWWSSSKSTAGSREHFLRLSLRSKRTDQVVDNPTIVIQYFAKRAAAKGKVSPEVLSVEHITLPRLTSQYVHIDLAPVTTKKSTYKYRSGLNYGGRYRTYHKTERGNEFYGVIVSVFDGEGKLVSQGASTSILENLASIDMAGAREHVISELP